MCRMDNMPNSGASELSRIIRARHSSRDPFDPARAVSAQDLMHILDAARWARTAHNMQNFEVARAGEMREQRRGSPHMGAGAGRR